jgi:hypothetical protein
MRFVYTRKRIIVLLKLCRDKIKIIIFFFFLQKLCFNRGPRVLDED